MELALRAASELGAGSVKELTLQAPLILPEGTAVALQVSVGGPDEGAEREIAIHSRPDGEEGEWVKNATGALSQKTTPQAEPLQEWPPPGAEPLQVDSLYERLADAGFEYGPAFQGLTAAWREGERIYAEVSLPEAEAQSARRFGIHPALLDSALHPIGLTKELEDMELPFSWSGVSVSLPGAGELRVSLASGAEGEVTLSLADPEGAPLGTVGSLALRPLSPGALQGAGGGPEGLYALRWTEPSMPQADSDPSEVKTGAGRGRVRRGTPPQPARRPSPPCRRSRHGSPRSIPRARASPCSPRAPSPPPKRSPPTRPRRRSGVWCAPPSQSTPAASR